jgi:hypothetical protein
LRIAVSSIAEGLKAAERKRNHACVALALKRQFAGIHDVVWVQHLLDPFEQH